MKDKIDYWKIASIILAIALILTLGIKMYNDQEVEISGVQITRGNFNDISDIVAESKSVVVCNIDSSKCFTILRTK